MNTDIHIAVDASQNASISPHFRALYATLRKQFPFIKNDTLQSIVDSAHFELCSKLREQAPAIEARKARFSFFNLPAELRNRIYEMAMPIENTHCVQTCSRPAQIEVYPISINFRVQSKRALNPPPLCRVSRQIRQETLPIFYGQNTFVAYVNEDKMDDVKDLRAWLNLLGPERARMIKSLVLRLPLPKDECSWRGYCTKKEPCTADTCAAWMPKSAADVAMKMRLPGGVPLKSFKAEFGANVEGRIWTQQNTMINLWDSTEFHGDASPLVEWTALQVPKT